MTATISKPELQARRDVDHDLVVIDVRTGAEFETSHIPGSYNIPLSDIDSRSAELAGLDRPVVVVCQSGARSATALDALERAGKTDVLSLEGGLNSWQASGGETAVGAKDTWAMDRQVRLAAGSLVLSGLLASTLIPKAKWLSGGIGAGLVFSAVSNTCTMGDMLAKLPYNQSEGYDIDLVLEELKSAG